MRAAVNCARVDGRSALAGSGFCRGAGVQCVAVGLWRIGFRRRGRVAVVTGRPAESPLARVPGVGMSAGSGEVGGLPGFVVPVGSPGLVGSRCGSSATAGALEPAGPAGSADPVEPAASTALAGSPASTGLTSPVGAAGAALLAGTVARVGLAGRARPVGRSGRCSRAWTTERVYGARRRCGSVRPAVGRVWRDGSARAPTLGSAGVDRWGDRGGGGDAGRTGAPTYCPASTHRGGQYGDTSMMAGQREHRSATQRWPSIRRRTGRRRRRLARPGAVGTSPPRRGRGSPPRPTAALSHESALRVRVLRYVLSSRGGVLPVADDGFTPASTRLGARRRQEVTRRSLEVRQCAMCRNWART
jgi:hypothetical protein